MTEGLNAGDKVIALAAAASTAAIVAGGVAGAVALWLTKHKLLLSFGGLLGGAILGWIIGNMVGRIIFPSSEGTVMIAKWGAQSLPLTIKGNVMASLAASLIVCGLTTIICQAEFKTVAGPCIGSAVTTGLVLAVLASLI